MPVSRTHVTVALLLVAALPSAARAQPTTVQAAAAVDPVPATIDACYVPASGTIYRISTTASPAVGAPTACLSAAHVKFTWNQQGPAGPAGAPGAKGDKGDPGSGANIGPDLTLPGALSMGKTGQFGGGLLATNANPLTIPAGAGTRFLWIPQKSAVRAGTVGGGQWDDANVGQYSTAFGVNAVASGAGAVAIGATTTASGANAVALGLVTTADGDFSTALGQHASTGGKTGAFVYGDASSQFTMTPDADNQFLVRAAGGVRLRTTANLTKGCDINGTGGLACTGGLLSTGVSSLTIPTGAGTRFMWVPQKTALRAGTVDDAQWNDANVGQSSVALGTNTTASGVSAIAIGNEVIASGDYSMALGTHASSGGKAGAFVYGDASSPNTMEPDADNQFLVRAAGGIRLRTTSDLSRGCTVDGGGNLTCTGTVTGTNTGNIGPNLTLPGALSMGKTGTFGGGLLATSTSDLSVPSGGGGRLMWVPQNGALRAGFVSGAQWDAANIGNYSVALGLNTVGSGAHSTALGSSASTNGQAGAFVYGDNSTTAEVRADAENQFVVRAAGGVKLRTTADLSKGCNVDGAGNLSCTGTVTGTNTGAIGPDLTLPGALSMGKTGTFGGGLLATAENALTLPSRGTAFMWVPQKAAVRAGQALTDEWSDANIGSYSTALGVGARAGGAGAVALGASVTASGANSVALGLGTVASGKVSVALGHDASTNGMTGSFVYGDNSGGTVASDTENQFLVRAAGGVKLRTAGDLSKGCNVDGSGNLSCTGTVTGTNTTALGPDLTLPGALSMGKTGTFGGGLLASDGTSLTVPSGSGVRFMWVPQKAALRAGSAGGTEWNDANIGQYSVALGVRTTASGAGAVAIGASTIASGANGLALGLATTASGDFSTALGQHASTNGKVGAFVYGDNSTSGDVQADAENQFLVRAAGGVKLRTTADLSKGCDIDGAGDLSCTGGVTAPTVTAPTVTATTVSATTVSATTVTASDGVSMTSTLKRIVGASLDVPPGTARSEHQDCPAGYLVIGGGVHTAGGRPRVLFSHPDYGSDQWKAWVANDGSNDTTTIEIYVVCVRR